MRNFIRFDIGNIDELMHQDQEHHGKEKKMIHVIATVELKPGCRGAYLDILLPNVPNVKAEAGCLVHEPTIDTETDIPVHEKAGDDECSF